MDTFQIIALCCGAYHVYRYIDRVFDPEPKEEEVIEKKKIQYFVNNREIAVPLHIYYKGKLGLFGKKRVNNDTIRKAYFQKLNVIEVNNKEESIYEKRNLKAARLYILDEWVYFISKN